MNQEELNVILKNHLHWINEDCDGWEAMRADLIVADLREADLNEADLRGAYLMGADLRGADLIGADLRGADLRGADLIGAYLREANLNEADLRGAYLMGANLVEADLVEADLRGANLNEADLVGADLREANLNEADLRGAYLYGADLRGADLIGVDLRGVGLIGAKISIEELNKALPICCPEEGEFIGWKKADSKIVKLKITEDAKRSSATTRKCRCNKAIVLAIENTDGSPSGLSEVRSNFDKSFIYKVGETIEIKDFDEDRKNECAPGIHFFITRQEAVYYIL